MSGKKKQVVEIDDLLIHHVSFVYYRNFQILKKMS